MRIPLLNDTIFIDAIKYDDIKGRNEQGIIKFYWTSFLVNKKCTNRSYYSDKEKMWYLW